jgi:hypothetical protein
MIHWLAGVLAVLLFSAPASAQSLEPVAPPQLRIDVEMFARGFRVIDQQPSRNEFDLPRAELGAQLALSDAIVSELRLEAVRSATPQSGFGIDGDSLLPRFKLANLAASQRVGDFLFYGSAGLVNDLWIMALDRLARLRPLHASASESDLVWSSSDLGVTARASWRWLALSAAVLNGEGRNYAERNRGKNSTAMIEAHPTLPSIDGHATQLWFAVMVRNGSFGPGAARDHRFGAATVVATKYVSVGAEVVRALGLHGQGDVVATSVASWLDVPVVAHVALSARISTTSFGLDSDTNATGRRSSLLAAVSYELFSSAPLPSTKSLRLWLTVERLRSTGISSSVAGTDAANATTAMVTVSVLAPFLSK